jgi:hypothetical protein
MVMIRATIGRLSFSTTARALMLRKVRGLCCIFRSAIGDDASVSIPPAGVNSLRGILIGSVGDAQKAEAKRQRIIDAAYECFWRVGYTRTVGKAKSSRRQLLSAKKTGPRGERPG